tara:strand:+ start:252 stop:956 length:705 start_codon:yes stop_codon:yes gene_type:complete
MNEELEFETFLSISPNTLEIYVFDKTKLINIYYKELKNFNENQKIELTQLHRFLEDNIFQIESLLGKFIKNIILIIEDEKILTFEISVKKKNLNKIVNSKDIENIVTETKDLVKENYQEFRIIHIIINNYITNNTKYSRAPSDFKCDNLCLEVKFILISSKLTSEVDNILERYQIKSERYLNLSYIKNYFSGKDIELSEMANKILTGCNENEVQIIPKSYKKKGFFEKFFQLFS